MLDYETDLAEIIKRQYLPCRVFKKPAQQGRKPRGPRGVYTVVHEQAKGLRTPLEVFFNTLVW